MPRESISRKEIVPVASLATMSLHQFNKFKSFIYEQCGIKLTETKKTLLEARLQKRIRKLGMRSFQEYEAYVFSPKGMDEELIQMIDVVTTNKTDFFREPGHFDYLVNNALPELMGMNGGVNRDLRVWSAGCSTGEEPYTLSMVLSDYEEKHPGVRFSVLASDISTKVLEQAIQGLYDLEKVAPVPLIMKKKYLLKHKDKTKKIVRITPELRNRVTFRRLNFMDSDYGMKKPLHIIFCRNVLIYFDRPTQERIINRFSQNLVEGGYVFLGHSETLNGMRVNVTQVSPTVYRKL